MKILLFDIETSPILANVWSLWSEVRDFKFVDVDWHVMSWSAKWLNDKKIMVKALPDYPLYKRDPDNDKELLKNIWALLDEADIVVGHNAQKFDCKKLNARFIANGMPPPSPYKIVDTLLVAKRYFSFTSNRLDTIGRILGLGEKIDTGGFDLWKKCLEGDKKAWKKMCEYNKQDVILLEKVYLKLRPYMQNHPNINISESIDTARCPCCGSEDLVRRGYAYTNMGKFARVCCNKCSKWSRVKISEFDKHQRAEILSNII